MPTPICPTCREPLAVAAGARCGRCGAAVGAAQAWAWTVGGDPGCDLVVRSTTISAKHARVCRTAAGTFVEDLGSTNGVWLDGRRLEGPTRVTEGVAVTLGRNVEMPWPPQSIGRVVRIGQASDNDVVVDRPQVSSHHALLVDAGDRAFLEDLGSTNGTLVGGRRIDKPTAVQGGEDIGLGRFSVKVVRAGGGFALSIDGGPPVGAPPPGSVPVVARTAAAAAAPAGGASAPASSSTTLSRAVAEVRQLKAEVAGERARDRRATFLIAVGAAVLLLAGGGVGVWVKLRPTDPTFTAPTSPAAPISPPPTGMLSAQELYKRNEGSVVLIRHVSVTSTGATSSSEGTGWVFDGDGHIITNRHVALPRPGGRTISLMVFRTGSATAITARAARGHPNPEVDLALVEVPRGTFPAVTGFDPDDTHVSVGDEVILIGYPLGTNTISDGKATPSLTKGTLSKKTTMAYQYDAASQPGSSGSPVFNQSGRVIAVNYAAARASVGGGLAAGINYGIPAHFVADLIR